jgi:hypothetical protein
MPSPGPSLQSMGTFNVQCSLKRPKEAIQNPKFNITRAARPPSHPHTLTGLFPCRERIDQFQVLHMLEVMDDDVRIQQHGRSIAERERAVPSDFFLPSRGIDNIPVWVQSPRGCQSPLPARNHLRRRFRLQTWLRSAAGCRVVNHQKHPRMPGPYPFGQGLGDCHPPIRRNLGLGCQCCHA